MIDKYEEIGIIARETFDAIQKILVYYRNKVWSDNKELLVQNEINQSFYLWALFENHDYEGLKKLNAEEISCRSQYNFIMGRMAYDEKQFEEAINYLKDYLYASRERGYARFITDRADRQVSGEFFIGMSYYNLGKTQEALEQFEKCEELTGNNHRKAREYINIIKQTLLN